MIEVLAASTVAGFGLVIGAVFGGFTITVLLSILVGVATAISALFNH